MTIAIQSAANNHAALDIAVPTQDQAIARLAEWAKAAQAAAAMATDLVRTSFVPAAYRNKPEEATAAILAGAEVGLSPMAALRAFDNIQGTPAPKAITLRAIVQAHGHKIRIDESTPTRAVVSGLTKGDSQWQTSTWTIERATQAGYVAKNPNYKTKSAEMLVARATAEVCRWVASDAIMGMPYTAEEIRDEGPGYEPRPAARRVTAAEVLASAPISAVPATDPADAPDDVEPDATGDGPEPMADVRMREMFALLREAAQYEPSLSDKDGQLGYIAEVVGREIQSRKELTAAEGDQIIASLRRYIAQQEPQDGES